MAERSVFWTSPRGTSLLLAGQLVFAVALGLAVVSQRDFFAGHARPRPVAPSAAALELGRGLSSGPGAAGRLTAWPADGTADLWAAFQRDGENWPVDAPLTLVRSLPRILDAVRLSLAAGSADERRAAAAFLGRAGGAGAPLLETALRQAEANGEDQLARCFADALRLSREASLHLNQEEDR